MERMLEWMEREAVAVICGVLVLVLVVVPRNAGALITVLVALCIPAIVFLLRPASAYPASGRTRLITAAAALPAVVAAAASIGAVSKPVALWGARGQHTGVWLWLAVWAVFFAFTERGRPGDLIRAARSIAVTGGVLGISALLTVPWLVDRFPSLYSFGLSDSPSGLIENSISLAQALLIALGAAAFLALRGGDHRKLGLAAAALCAVALAVTRTKAALAALLIAFVLLAVVRLVRGRLKTGGPAVVASLAVVVAIVLAGAALGAASLDPGSETAARIDSALSGRVTIWHAALAQLPDRLLLGAGPDHFTSWVRWDSVPGQSMEQVSTDDPHSWGLYWLLSAGIPGILAALVALWALTFGMASVLQKVGWRLDAMALCVGLASWGIALSTSWTGPLAACFASILAAAFVSAGDVQTTDAPEFHGVPYMHAAIALTLALGIVLSGTPLIRAELAWASALRARAPLALDRLMASAESADDPAYAVDAAKALHAGLMRTRDPQVASRGLVELVPVLGRHAEWSVYSALQAITLTADAALLNAGASEADVIAAVDAGRQVDPTTGLWDYVGAVHLTSLGRADAAQARARAAMEYPLPEPVRDWTKELVEQ